MEPATLPPVVGAYGTLKLHIDGLPAMKCAKGHAAPVDRDFMLWLMHELKGRAAKLPGGEEKGLLMKKYLCACGKELPKPAERRTFSEDIDYEGKLRFKAGLDVQSATCPGCGKQQVRSVRELQKEVSYALIEVTDAAGFPHGQ